MNLRQLSLVLVTTASLIGCGGGKQDAKDRDFTTSGDREADQRAEQRISKTQQLRGEGAKEGGVNKDAKVKATLYERLGGEKGITAIVDDWVTRALADPVVNWERKGVSGGVMGLGKDKTWNPNANNVAQMKKHIIQFLSLRTGGPAKYDGRDMKEVHTGMKITNPEFDAAVGDLKVSLDAKGVPTEEQKELLAIIESTRELIAEKR